jgi:predicted metal-dependent hydrolase
MQINITRKPTKYIRMSLDIKNKCLNVSAPKYLSDDKIMEFVRTKEKWVNSRIQKSEKMIPTSYEVEDGAKISIWGTNCILKIDRIESKTSSINIELIENILTISTPIIAPLSLIQTKIDLFLNGLLFAYIQEILPHWQSKVGSEAKTIIVKKAKSRWGSCNTITRKIMLNSKLIHLEHRFLEYVIMHELTHLKEASHNSRFYELCGVAMPEYRSIIKEFKLIKL